MKAVLWLIKRFEAGSAAAVVGTVVPHWTVDQRVTGLNPTGDTF